MSLQLSNISTSSEGESVLRDLSLRLDAEAFNVVLGPTGAGKTELLRVMAGLDRIDGGQIKLNGKDVTGVDVRRRNVAFVYQEFINYPNLTVYENIASPLRVRGQAAEKIDPRVRTVAGRLGLDALLDRLPGELSGGQQQRVALGRALVRDAELVLLDEPLVNLDYKLRERLRREIREIFAGSESIVVFATSDPTEAQLLGGRLTVLSGGQVLQSGPAAEQYRRPTSVRAAEILSDPPLNLIEARVENELARLPGTDLVFSLAPNASKAAAAAGACLIGFRPHQIRLKSDPEARQLEGRVKLAELSGSETFLHLEIESNDLIVQQKGTHAYSMEENVQLFVREREMFVYSVTGELLHAPDTE